MNSIYQPRTYRQHMGNSRFKSFTLTYKETDLWIGINGLHPNEKVKDFVYHQIVRLRRQLEEYIKTDPGFFTSLSPYRVLENAPDIAHKCSAAGTLAGVGPMAAVAGAFSQEIGKRVLEKFNISEIIVENGGDIYADFIQPLLLSVYSGASPLSGKIGIEISPSLSPLGICTSSATIGHSLSFGKADSVTVLCRDAAVADAFATMLCNMVMSANDIGKVLDLSTRYEHILGVVIVIGDKIGARGNIRLVPLQQ